MDAQQFAYWLQGFAELSGETPPTPEQWKSIREHLATVFVKVTPPVYDPKRDGPAVPYPALPSINPGLRWPPQTAAKPWVQMPTVTCRSGSVSSRSDLVPYC